MRWRVAVLVVAAIAAGSMLVTGAGAGTAGSNPGILPPSSQPFGLTYGEWQGRFFQWLEAIPASQNPAFENGDCSTGQGGKVWFLAPVFTTPETSRTCVVPPGVALLVPVLGNECSSLEPEPFFGADQEELQACASSGYEFLRALTNPSLTVDGVLVRNIDQYRNLTPAVPVFLPPNDNVWGLPAGGGGLAAADGISLLLAPLSVGTHSLRIAIDFPGLLTVVENYTVVVEPPGRGR